MKKLIETLTGEKFSTKELVLATITCAGVLVLLGIVGTIDTML